MVAQIAVQFLAVGLQNGSGNFDDVDVALNRYFHVGNEPCVHIRFFNSKQKTSFGELLSPFFSNNFRKRRGGAFFNEFPGKKLRLCPYSPGRLKSLILISDQGPFAIVR